MAQPSAQEQYMLELVNRARLDPQAEANRYNLNLNQGLAPGTISSSTKQPLAFNLKLIDAARSHSQWMIDTDNFSHTGAGGSSVRNRIEGAGYTFSGASSWGENISSRGTTGTPNVTAFVGSQHEGLFKSPGHRTNILGDSFKEIGIGTRTGEFRGYNGVLTTQKYAYTGNTSFLTGVAYDDAITDDDFYTVGEGLGGINVTATRLSDSATFSTQTFGSGGYQIALAPGDYRVAFSGGGLAQTVQENVSIGSRNIKLDLATDELPPVSSSPRPPAPSTPRSNPTPALSSSDTPSKPSVDSAPAGASSNPGSTTRPPTVPTEPFNGRLDEAPDFDAVQYVASYQDLIAAIGLNGAAAEQHFRQQGIAENRAADLFDEVRYLASNKDLIKAFGTNFAAAAEHYVRVGAAENRSVDSFDAASYLSKNADIQAVMGDDLFAATLHYIQYGHAERRQTSASKTASSDARVDELLGFDPVQYAASHRDILTEYGLDKAGATDHYRQLGIAEQRSADLFDEVRYLASNDDLIAAYGDDLAAASEHYVRIGASENRSMDAFDPISYLQNNGDVQAVLGNDLHGAALHYIRHGFAENRSF